MFLEETKKKRKDQVQELSSDSGIELSQQKAGEGEEESDDVTGQSGKDENSREDGEGLDCQVPLILESDVDSESDPEAVASDTELLVNERRGRTKVSWVKFRNLRDYFNDTRTKVASCCAGCIACGIACYSCTWTHQLTREKIRELTLSKLRSVRNTLKQTFRLMNDRRILLSTSLYGLAGYLVLVSQEVSYL